MKGHIRFDEIDIIKGIAILLVIMGHSFCNFPIDLSTTTPVWLQNFVYTAQMPVFFIASGFLFKSAESWSDFLGKKFKRILLPYLVFNVVAIGLKVVAESFSRSGEEDVIAKLFSLTYGGGYWFLYALMVIMIVCRLSAHRAYLPFLATASVVATLLMPEGAPQIVSRICYYTAFFILGINIKKVYHWVVGLGTSTVAWCAAISLALYSVMCGAKPTNISELANGGGILALVLYKYIMQLVGCLAVWTMSITLAKKWQMSVLMHFGKYSLQYYLNHMLIMLGCYYFAKFLNLPFPILSWLLIFILGVFISWCMLQIEKFLPLFRKLSGL